MKTDTKQIILERAVELFAEHGFNGVSMRDIAKTVGIRAPALYNHYRDKQDLYIAAISEAFSSKQAKMFAALNRDGGSEQQLQAFIRCICQDVYDDQAFLRLLQRETLDGDSLRQQRLAKEVFGEIVAAVAVRIAQIDAECDAQLTAKSIFGMVIEHFKNISMSRFMPGHRPEHENPQYVAEHIIKLLFNGLQQRT